MDEKHLNLRSMQHTPANRTFQQATICSSPPPAYSLYDRQRSTEDLFTVTPRSKGDDIGSVTDIKTVWRSDSVLTEIGSPRRGWTPRVRSQRSKCVLAIAVVIAVILALLIFLVVYSVKKNGSGDSSSDDEAHVQSDTGTKTSTGPPTQATTDSFKSTQISTESTKSREASSQSTTSTRSFTESTNPITNTALTSNSVPTLSADWAFWESWTSCSVTCGSGVHVRYRTCNKTGSTEADCEGQYVQQAVCTLDDCPVHGKWTTWSPWGECGATCGGSVRSRSRQCNKQSDSDIDCVGESVQQKNCNEWDCPDCSQTCSIGQLNDVCDTCICESSRIQGRVLSAAGNPVSYADIATGSAPTRVIAQSNSTGFFTLDDTCITTTVVVSREGFQNTVAEITASSQTIYMEKEVLPRFTEHPQSKYRLTGEDVTFCCSAISAPEITYYEWFLDSVLLDGSLYAGNGTMLELKNVQPLDSGEYKCRANNDVRGIYSNAALLSVKDNEDSFCEDALQEKQVSLPEACVQPGRDTTLYEVGDCASKTCRQVGANGTEQCRGKSKSCCVPSKFESKYINCTDYVIELIVVKACSCGSCESSESVSVTVKVVSAQTGSPVAYAEIWLNGELLDYADDVGSLYTSVPDSIGKAVFTVKDTGTNVYLESTKVVYIVNGMGGTISVTIRMIEISDPITIDSTSETVLSLDRAQNDPGGPAALIKVPANAFYRSDGSAYTGMVSSFVTFIDPTDDSIGDAIPGVFQVVDEEGSLIDLESYGMFNLQFQDDAGNALYIDVSIEVSFPDQPAGNFTLWVLNTESGLWESINPSVISYRRKRRQMVYQADSVIGEIDMSSMPREVIYNIDQIPQATSICYFKVRLYKDATLSGEVINDYAQYKVDYRVISGQTLLTLNYKSMPDYDFRTYCFTAACNKKLGYISLETYHVNVQGNVYNLKASDPLLADHNLVYNIIHSGNTIGAIMESSDNGPFYKNYSTCSASDINESHLRFHKNSTPEIYTARFFSPGGSPLVNRKIMDTVWYPTRKGLHMICLAKVKITFSISSLSAETALKFHVFSFGGSNMDIKGFLFGIREYEVSISDITQFICVEYKCSGTLEKSSKEDFTRVRIALASRSAYTCQPVAVSENIVNYSLNDHLRNSSYLSQTQSVEAYAPDNYGSSWGIYEAHIPDKNFETARNKVTDECMENVGDSVHIHCQIP